MEPLLLLGTALAGWAFAVFVTIVNRQDEGVVRDAHAMELERRDEKITQLLDQVQLNSQNMPYYPTLGPFPQDTGPEPKYLASDDGLIVFEDVAMDEVAR